MQHYQSHKVVKAGKILGFNAGVRVEDDKGILERFAVRFQVDNGIEGSPPELVDAPMDVFARGRCEIGDYLVRYEDGYMAWSPADAFEDGYRAVEVAQSIDMNQKEFERKYPGRVEPLPDDKTDTESLIEDQWPPEGHSLLSDGPIPDPKQSPENDIFTRGAMCQIRDDAKAKVYDENNDMHSGVDINWIRAWFDLMMAADRLDAMIARSEAIPSEGQEPNEKWVARSETRKIYMSDADMDRHIGVQSPHDAMKFNSESACQHWIIENLHRYGYLNLVAEKYFRPCPESKEA